MILKQELKKDYFDEGLFGELLKDLSMVGPDKPIGYLPLNTLNKMGINYEDAKIFFENRGLKTLMLDEEKSNVVNGAFYVYDVEFLNRFLNREDNINILKKNNWPIDADEFIKHLNESAEPKSKLFDLIADAFADFKNLNRKKLK